MNAHTNNPPADGLRAALEELIERAETNPTARYIHPKYLRDILADHPAAAAK